MFADDEGIDAASAGTSVDADTPVSADLFEWADVIFAMERVHQRRLIERFGPLLKAKHVVVRGISDEYKYMDPKLVEVLRRKVSPHLARYGCSRVADQS